MSLLFLNNKDGSIQVEIAPAHGGMITQILLKGKELLNLNRQTLQTAPMAAGGAPILFPFSSKTKDDSYQLEGKTYQMPMHGLVKNDAFAVAYADEQKVILWTENQGAWKQQNYPFDFQLRVTYALEGNELSVEFEIENRSKQPMPHYLGWHPYFRSTDKKRIHLKHPMTVQYDYQNCVDIAPADLSDLSLNWDDVFHTCEDPGFELTNEADGYQVTCTADPVFQSMVVCSWVENSMCVEPWIGIPDGINQKRFVEWIPGGEKRSYKVVLKIEEADA